MLVKDQETFIGHHESSVGERYKLGNIHSVERIEPREIGVPEDLSPEAVYRLSIRDPYLEMADPDLLDAVSQYESYIGDFARKRREQGHWDRRAGTAYVDAEGNPATKSANEWGDPVASAKCFREVVSDALLAWRSKIPSAKALGDLSDPFYSDTILDKDDREWPFDDVAKHWLAGCTDGRAIRNRGTVMAELVKTYIHEMHQEGQNPKWMSVACGTALPSMKAAVHAGISPDLYLVDWDHSAMDATEKLAGEVGFQGRIEKKPLNIFNPHDLAALRGSLGSNGERPRILDLMGIFEYTGEHIGMDPAVFLRANYDMLHPGGVLVFGQMRKDRPLQDFTMGVVGWPYIVMRSPKEVMEIIKAAGISPGSAKLYLPDDNVYTICAIRKPAGPEEFAI